MQFRLYLPIILILILFISCTEMQVKSTTTKIENATHINPTKEIPFAESQFQDTSLFPPIYPKIEVVQYGQNNIDFIKLKEELHEYTKNGVTISERKYYFDGLTNFSLNPKYLEGLSKIKVMIMNDCGHFDEISLTEGVITLNPLCKNKSYWFLSELKHLWCYTHTGNLEPTHQGCFLDTPIDKEYGLK